LSPSYCSFISSATSITIPKNVNETLDYSGWQQAMIAKMQALDHNSTGKLVPLPPGKKTIEC